MLRLMWGRWGGGPRGRIWKLDQGEKIILFSLYSGAVILNSTFCRIDGRLYFWAFLCIFDTNFFFKKHEIQKKKKMRAHS